MALQVDARHGGEPARFSSEQDNGGLERRRGYSEAAQRQTTTFPRRNQRRDILVTIGRSETGLRGIEVETGPALLADAKLCSAAIIVHDNLITPAV